MLSWLDSQPIDTRRSRAAIFPTAVQGVVHNKLWVELTVSAKNTLSTIPTDVHVRARAVSGMITCVTHTTSIHMHSRLRGCSARRWDIVNVVEVTGVGWFK